MTPNLAAQRRQRARAFVKESPAKNKAWDTKSYAYDYETEKPMFLGWMDDNPKKTTAQKIDEAIAAFRERFRTAPTVVLVNEAELIDVAGVTVRSESYIRRNNYWIGMAEA